VENLLGIAWLSYRAVNAVAIHCQKRRFVDNWGAIQSWSDPIPEGLAMSLPKTTKGSKLLARKRKLQREFLQQAKAEGLSTAQTVERASIFPKGIKPKVVKWPKF